MLPPKSLPVASHTCPAASAAADPPEDPLEVVRVSHGLRVAPKTSLNVLPPAANSGRFDLPMTMAPLASRRSTTTSEAGAMRSA
jgi:hypothetical protein